MGVVQRKGPQDVFMTDVRRTHGDLLLVRGDYVLAELKLSTLLRALDALPGEHCVHCSDPDVVVFFARLHPATTSVTFTFKIRQGRRDYTLHERPGHALNYADVPREFQAQRLVSEDLEDARLYLQAAKTILTALPAKRKRVEEYEAQWHKRPRVAGDDE
jgi:hypothetical protein